eukprot:scaffold2477_cov95-Isochrysis_galbana.AAC.8
MSRHSGAVNWKLSVLVRSTSCVDPLVFKLETHPATPTYLIVKANGAAAGGLVLECYIKMPKGARVRAPEKFHTALNGEWTNDTLPDMPLVINMDAMKLIVKTNIVLPAATYNIALHGWHLLVMAILMQRPDSRTIIWCWSEKGTCGKTSLVKYIRDRPERFHSVTAGGKKSDIFHAIAKQLKDGGHVLTVIANVCRGETIDYSALEAAKDGTFNSGKYAGTPVDMPHPHVVVFANYPPDETNTHISADRFRIFKVDDYHGTVSPEQSYIPVENEDDADDTPPPRRRRIVSDEEE